MSHSNCWQIAWNVLKKKSCKNSMMRKHWKEFASQFYGGPKYISRRACKQRNWPNQRCMLPNQGISPAYRGVVVHPWMLTYINTTKTKGLFFMHLEFHFVICFWTFIFYPLCIFYFALQAKSILGFDLKEIKIHLKLWQNNSLYVVI